MEEIVEVAKFRVKILKCSQHTFWYNDRIGEEFSVIDVSSRDYYVFEKESSHGILIVDAVIIK